MATTYTTFLDNSKTMEVWNIAPNHRLIRNRVSFATQNLIAGTGDVHQLITVPANCLVIACFPVVTTAAASNATADLGYGSDVNLWGNAIPLDATGCNQILSGTVTRATASGNIADAASETLSATVDGAAYGDVVTWEFSAGNTLISAASNLINVTAAVTGSNAVKVVLDNETGAVVDPDGTFTVWADKAPRGYKPILLSATSEDTIDLTATTDIADVDITTGVVEVWAELYKLTGLF